MSARVAKKALEVVPSSAVRINEAHRLAIEDGAKAMLTGIDRAIEVGRLLAEEKAKHKHGEWIPWIEANLEFGKQQTAAYMRAFDRREEITAKAKVATLATFGLGGIKKLLAKPRGRRQRQTSWDFQSASLALRDRILKEATEWPADYRVAMVAQLKNLCDELMEIK